MLESKCHFVWWKFPGSESVVKVGPSSIIVVGGAVLDIKTVVSKCMVEVINKERERSKAYRAVKVIKYKQGQ